MVSEPIIICGLCKRPLFTSVLLFAGRPIGVEFKHSDDDIEQDDSHEPLPVKYEPGQGYEPKCDFCGGETDYWVMDVKPFGIQVGNEVQNMDSLWVICPGCRKSYTHGGFKALAKRQIREHEARFPSPDEEERQARIQTFGVLIKGVEDNFVKMRESTLAELTAQVV